MSKHVTRYANV